MAGISVELVARMDYPKTFRAVGLHFVAARSPTLATPVVHSRCAAEHRFRNRIDVGGSIPDEVY